MTEAFFDLRSLKTRYNEERSAVEWLHPETGEVLAAVTSEVLANGGKEATDSVFKQLRGVA